MNWNGLFVVTGTYHKFLGDSSEQKAKERTKETQEGGRAQKGQAQDPIGCKDYAIMRRR
jgi:hypothetical protein